jgi:prephenate dehydrogenase
VIELADARVADARVADARVAIVGLGLMGGSLAGALRGRCRAVLGVARRAETIETALARGLVNRGTTDLASGVRDADVVILATPVLAILHLLDEIGPLLATDCLLMDMGSTKAQVVRRMAGLPDHVQPLGGHPLCGREVSGIGAADPALYRGNTFVLTPLARTSEAALALGIALVEAIGAAALVLDPERHDHLLATVSHLPYVVACALIGAGQAAASTDSAVWETAASGFRDTSRLASSDVTMMLDTLLTNQEAVLASLDAYQVQLRELAHLLRSADEESLRSALASTRDQRNRVFGQRC